MSSKKRSYKEAFLNFGFSLETSVIEDSVAKPQYVICCKVPTQKSMRLSCILSLVMANYSRKINSPL